MRITIGKYYHFKRGENRNQIKNIIKVTETGLHIIGIRLSDNRRIFIERSRITSEVTKEDNPEYFL